MHEVSGADPMGNHGVRIPHLSPLFGGSPSINKKRWKKRKREKKNLMYAYFYGFNTFYKCMPHSPIRNPGSATELVNLNVLSLRDGDNFLQKVIGQAWAPWFRVNHANLCLVLSSHVEIESSMLVRYITKMYVHYAFYVRVKSVVLICRYM